LPKPPNTQWADEVSETFRSYFTIIAEAKTVSIESVLVDRSEYVASVATVLRVEEAADEIETQP
jgi:hypothetical protein